MSQLINVPQNAVLSDLFSFWHHSQGWGRGANPDPSDSSAALKKGKMDEIKKNHVTHVLFVGRL